MGQEKTKECSICGFEAELKYVGFPGYIEGMSYDIYECKKCRASFVSPLEVDEKIYDFIYNQAEELVGYERYYRYAELVEKFSDPLSFLATTEPSYWAVISEIKKDIRNPKELNILEVGSGLGYLTYSLNKSGFKCTGIDISQEVVVKATNRYGNYFKNQNLTELIGELDRYDYVIMMDVIEHVESPVHFIQLASSLLKSEGKILVTTPNKDSVIKDKSLWQSDAPPIHLWFLSEESLCCICENMNYKLHFVSFKDYNEKLFSPRYESSLNEIKGVLPRLDKFGVARNESKVNSVKSKFLGLKLRYFLSYLRRRLLRKTNSEKATTMCAVISKS